MSLRDILVTAVVLGAVPFALRRPWIGIILWAWLSLMNPHKLAWGFAYNAPFAAIAAGATLLGLFITKDRVRLNADAIVFALLAFLIWMSVTTVLAFDRTNSLMQLNKVFKIQLMTLVAIAVIHEWKHLRAFIWINVLSLGFYGVKGGIFTLRTGGVERVWGPPGGFIEGNNELALALVMTIPLMYFLRLTETRAWLRHVLLAMMILTALSALGTQSRGALLALAAMGALLWWRMPRKLLSIVPVLVVAVALIMFMPESWLDRMHTIQNYQDDGSAMGRINAWSTMLNLANDRITGGGFAIYTREVYAHYANVPSVNRAAHSIYFQVLGEHGWIGLSIFLSIWLLGWRIASRVRSRVLRNDMDRSFSHLVNMCQVSLMGYAVGGAFLSLAYFDLPYNILIMLIVVNRLATQPDSSKVPELAANFLRPRQVGAVSYVRHSRGGVRR